jgi:cbb3-type cytochrome oxidase maturation protein
MISLLFLIPASLALGGAGLAAFLWALNSGQYEDLDGAALRVLDDGDVAPGKTRSVGAHADGAPMRRQPGG